MDQLTDVDRVPDDIARAVLDPRAYGEWHDLHQKLATLRREHPFARADLEGYDPFWIAAKFADIQEIALRGDVFLSGLGAMQSRKELEMNMRSSGMFRSVVAMNAPEHPKYRLLTQSWFQPKNIRDLEGRFRNLAKMHVDRLAATGGECGFVRDVAVHYPPMVIMSILGAPMEDEPMAPLSRMNRTCVVLPTPSGCCVCRCRAMLSFSRNIAGSARRSYRRSRRLPVMLRNNSGAISSDSRSAGPHCQPVLTRCRTISRPRKTRPSSART